ncbi:MAG: copper amine oxidase N-terminal domain-containing protein, partial [Defluviitaleaceae bacterium]|nr:copper amine oxidase N-terminal domain-containing protein [Defluviitaleaceae bacterium]
MQNLQNLKIAAVLTLVAAAMLWLMAVPAYASDVRVTIDGEAVIFAEQPPVIVDGRVLVPVRGVFEELGFTVSWNRDTRQAILERADYTIVLTIGSEAFTTNNTIAYLDVPAQII